MKLKSGALRLLLTFGCGLFWNAVPAIAAPTWRNEVGLAVEDKANLRSYRDVGAAIWPMTWEVDYEKPAGTTRSQRTSESMKEAIIMIDDFWRTFGSNSDTEEQDILSEEEILDVESDNPFIDENDETNDEAETDEQITSRFSGDSYQDQEVSTDVPQPPQQHLSLYPPYRPGYATVNNFQGNYLLRPPPSMYPSTIPFPSYYGSAVAPGDISLSNQDPEMDMEFHGNRAPTGMTPVVYPRSMSQKSQYALQYPPNHPQLMLNYYMMNAANFQNPHMNPGTPQAPQMGYSSSVATQTSPVGSSIPQPSYPFLGSHPTSLSYPYHQ